MEKKAARFFINMSLMEDVKVEQLEQSIDIFNDGRHIFDPDRTAIVDINFSVLSEPPLGQGSTLPTLEVSRILEDYDMKFEELLRQKELITIHQGLQFNLMVAGQSGLGKRTFVNSLFNTIIIPSPRKNRNNHCGSTGTRILECHKAKINFGSTLLSLKVVTTPGYGGKLDNSFAWIPLVNYVEEQLRSYVFQEEQPQRETLCDNRVHCCLYFIPPTNKEVSPLDIITMRELSKRINLIPIIAKADALNRDELNAFKQKVRKTLQENEVRVCRLLESELSHFDDIFNEFPLDIISSNDMVFSGSGSYIRYRKYSWGSINVEDPTTSQQTLLKQILFDTHFFDFITSMESYYEKYRSCFLRGRVSKARYYLDHNDISLPPIDNETLEIITALDFDNLDNNGLLNYSCYKIFDKKYMDSLVMENSPRFVQKVLELQKKMEAIIKRFDQEFKEEEETLINMQVEFNDEAEKLNCDIQNLQLECYALENSISKRKTTM